MTNTAICYRKFGRISSHLASSDIDVANNANARQTRGEAINICAAESSS